MPRTRGMERAAETTLRCNIIRDGFSDILRFHCYEHRRLSAFLLRSTDRNKLHEDDISRINTRERGHEFIPGACKEKSNNHDGPSSKERDSSKFQRPSRLGNSLKYLTGITYRSKGDEGPKDFILAWGDFFLPQKYPCIKIKQLKNISYVIGG